MDARLCPAPADEVVAIDGKSVRGSRSTNQRGIHLISAWASQLGVSLGQVCTADKSNEITAIPKLFDVLLLKSATKATKAGIKNRRLTAGPVVLTAPPSYVCDISCDCPAKLSPLHNGSNLNEQGAWQRQGWGRSVEVSGNRLCREPSVWGG
ncbi:MAG: hypothetical protein V4796_26540 [Burkholderia cenocepacia]